MRSRNSVGIASWGDIFFSIRMATPCTNNLVEYEAVRKGMELLLEAGAEAVEIDVSKL